MYYTNKTAGSVFIVAGLLLFLFAASDFLWRIMLILIAISLINNGLRMRGLPPLPLLFQVWFNTFRF